MSLRPPQSLSTSPRWETGASVLDAEIAAERAASLGRAGRAVERAMTALAACPVDAPDRSARVTVAADAVWGFTVQREALGLNDHRDALAHYGVTPEVLARVGAR